MFVKPLSVSHAQSSTADLKTWFESQQEKQRFNGSVLVSHRGEIVFEAQYGFRDLAQTVPIDSQTQFNLASVSKQFTAFGVLLLAHQGKVALDEPVSTYIPELNFENTPTLRSLLHHQAGLAEYFFLPEEKPTLENPMTNSEAVNNIARRHTEKKPPKPVDFRYSNSGYIVLAHVIERVSGKSFEQFMAEEVFEPAGLHNTRVFNLLSEEPLEYRAMGLKLKSNGKTKLRDLNEWDGVAGDGAVYSTARDLLAWHQVLQNGSLIPSEVYAQAMQPPKGQEGSKKPYGYGWFILGENEVDHAGGWQGFSSYFYRNEQTDSTIILLDNASHGLSMAPNGWRWNSISLNVRHWLANQD